MYGRFGVGRENIARTDNAVIARRFSGIVAAEIRKLAIELENGLVTYV